MPLIFSRYMLVNRPKISNQIQILSHSTIWFIHEVYNNSLFGGLFIMTYIVRLLFNASDDHIQLVLMWNLCTISYYWLDIDKWNKMRKLFFLCRKYWQNHGIAFVVNSASCVHLTISIALRNILITLLFLLTLYIDWCDFKDVIAWLLQNIEKNWLVLSIKV